MSFLEDQIMQSRTIAITGHTRPDGDCVGACMGLYNYIVENYPEIRVDVFLEPIAGSYKLIKRTDEIRQPEGRPEAYDLFICLDNSQKDRMTKGMEAYFDAAAATINVDHHISNTRFAQTNHVVAEASSASEVLYDLLDPEKITLLVDGSVVTGYADGSSISADRTGDDVTPKTGIQGDTVYVCNADRSGTIKFSLFPTSASLSRMRRLAQQRKQVAVTLRNANDEGGFIISHTDCRVLKVPKFEGGNDAAGIEVSIHVPVMEFRE